jgi:hypothetical protein
LTNSQRALWMVVIMSLAAPFFAGCIELVLRLAGPLAEFLLPPADGAAPGELAIGAFVWSVLPATAAAVGLLPFVLQHGTYGWLEAAIAGVLGFGAGAIIFPLGTGSALPMLAFLGGIVAIAVRAVLIWAGILKRSAERPSG